MNKKKLNYLKFTIMNSIIESYGDTIWDGDTDLEMTNNIIKKIIKSIDQNSLKELSDDEFEIFLIIRREDFEYYALEDEEFFEKSKLTKQEIKKIYNKILKMTKRN